MNLKHTTIPITGSARGIGVDVSRFETLAAGVFPTNLDSVFAVGDKHAD